MADGGNRHNADQQSNSGLQKPDKDPRIIARKYQIELCKKAVEENIIVYLGTGCGKTHIAVLLIYEMGHLIKKPQKNICVFLAPTVALVEQQAIVIQDSTDFKVGVFCGNSNGKKSHHEWEKEMERYEVFVMTPQTLLHDLSHCFIRIEQIALLIFDECHYAQLESNHPYAEIMKVFYKTDAVKLPRIFGMTASPKFGKGASINSLETLLHAKICSIEDEKELQQFVTSPKVNIYYYSNNSSAPHTIYSTKLEEIKYKQYLSTLSMKADDNIGLRNSRMSLHKRHNTLLLCLESLGLLGALQMDMYLKYIAYRPSLYYCTCSDVRWMECFDLFVLLLSKASHILSKGDQLDETERQCSGNSICQRYLSEVASAFASDCLKVQVNGTRADLSHVEVLEEPFFSRKLLLLIGVLSNFRLQPDMKCIVFVDRIITARSLAYILENLKFLSFWKCEFLVGVNSGLMSRKNTNIILEKFRSGELNLLVATKVGEEGLDIQTCCLVIRFDLPQTVASFIQSKGRARMAQSEYAFLVDSGNEKELNLINNFITDEDKMNMEIASKTGTTTTVDSRDRIYRVDSTGSAISAGYSVSLLHNYCAKLPRDEYDLILYFDPKLQFFYFDDAEGTICSIILPTNAPIHQIFSSPQSSMESAKKDACLKACEELHKLGALTDHLLPDGDCGIKGFVDASSDLDSCDEQDTRRELYEMLIPAVLREPWSNLENKVRLNSYLIKFSPHPVDRIYKEFGLFVKVPLPLEAGKMKVDLHLALGRRVYTELVPNGVATFDKDEIVLAEKFHEMCLKVILDRTELIPEFVSLGENDFSKSSSSTFYLMLPVITYEYVNKMTVDWKLVRRCLSSPIFCSPEDTVCNGTHNTNILILANGTKSVAEVVNSFVYAPCKNIFFFVTDIIPEKNGYSEFKESISHVEHYVDVFGIHLSYPDQPLLKAKRLFCSDNLLRKKGHFESREKEEHFIELPPEICQLKIIGFSKDIGSSLSLLPSIMHRLENLLVAIQLKHKLSTSFPEGAKVGASRVLEALTTEKCNERFSLERLEVLGDAFLKFAVGRHLFLLHDALDEGQLTRKRSNIAYIRDWSFEPSQFFAFGRPCSVICTKETETSVHSPTQHSAKNGSNAEVKCNKNHNWLYKKTIADVVEALVGAFIVDSGFKAAIAFLEWIGIQVDFKASEVTKLCFSSSSFMPLTSQIDISALEHSLGYRFLHKGLLIQAFVHPSYNNNCGGCYQRLEFLGDAVLDYLITSYLYSVYPKLKPGQLTDLRSVSVNNNSFADVAVYRSFHKYILCDSINLCESMNKYVNFVEKSVSEEGLVEERCPKALGDLVESCIGAILLDSGFDLKCVWKIMLSFLDPIMNFSKLQLSPIRELQELCQSRNWDLQFPALKKDKEFTVEAKVNGEGICETASATCLNIKAARRMAAKDLFSRLKAEGFKTKYKSLEEILKMNRRMEAKLIGYDEKPTYVANVEPQRGAHNTASIDMSPSETPTYKDSGLHKEEAKSIFISGPSVWPIRPPPRGVPTCEPAEKAENNSCLADSQNAGGSHKTAKSCLYEVCTANYWAPPIFECWKETGPSHLKEYIFKVVVVIEGTPDTVLDCFSKPRGKKKDAAEHAAEGALWYLKHEGYFQDKD
ncbi:hypothetical protein LguiA_011144 [Lonicera macranthoides]